MEPLHFATFAVLYLMIGLTTPPVGVCLFICANIARLPLTPVIKAIAPFLLTNILVLMLVSYVPAIATWLPSVLLDWSPDALGSVLNVVGKFQGLQSNANQLFFSGEGDQQICH